MNDINLQLKLRSHSNCIDNIYYIFIIKINYLGNINIQERKQFYDINTGYIISDNNKELLVIDSNNQLSESMMLFLYKTFISIIIKYSKGIFNYYDI